MMINEYFAQSVKIVAEKAAHFIQDNFGKVKSGEIVTKDLNSLVSFVDVEAEKIILNGLNQVLPGSSFLAEEGTSQEVADSEIMWIVDPLDGTTNFLHQIPVFAISIALQVQGEIVFGMVYEVNRNECFHAIKGKGAFVDNQPIRVQESLFSDSLIATGFPYYDFSQASMYLNTLESIIQNTRGVRRLGAAAVDLAYVSCGRFNGFFEYSLAPWDVAAGALLVQEAGGVVTDFEGGQNWLHGKSIIAGSPTGHQELFKLIQQNFKQ